MAAHLSESETARARLSRGEHLLGTVVTSPDLALAEQLGRSFDFLWIDLEHSPLGVGDAQALCIVARGAGSASFVRVRDPTSTLVPVLLDMGVDGLIAPRVDDVDTATLFARAFRYPPDGSRGFAHRRFTNFGMNPELAAAEEHVPLCLVQIESAAAVERAEQIALVDGVDGLIVGPSDLALDLGIEGGLESDELLSAVRAVQDAASRAGVVSGLAGGESPEILARTLGPSGSLLAYSTDMRIYATAIGAAVSTISDAWRERENHGAADATSRPDQEGTG